MTLPPSIPSRIQLPPGEWRTVLDALCDRFPHIDRATWRDRFERGRVQDAQGTALEVETPYRVGLEVRYFREVVAERRIDAREAVLHVDAHLVVADKPHFLPVVPAGRYVRETLLARLIERLGNPQLVPLHRIDRETAGLVLFSAQPRTRAAYQALFRQRRIDKRYLAMAPPLPHVSFPAVRRSRIEAGEPFFRMQEGEGDANSETHVDVAERHADAWTYALTPVTGRKHQLRVHMAALGAPIFGDRLYPCLRDDPVDHLGTALRLLAWQLAFDDPLTGERRSFESGLRLQEWRPER